MARTRDEEFDDLLYTIADIRPGSYLKRGYEERQPSLTISKRRRAGARSRAHKRTKLHG